MLRIVRRDPFYPILNMFDEFMKNSLSENTKSDNPNISAKALGFTEAENYARLMAIDVIEAEKEFKIKANLPGVPKENVSITIEEKQLVLTANQDEQKVLNTENMIRSERYLGKYQRMISLPDTCDSDGIKAKLVDGVLEILIPKKEPTPKKMVEIENV